MNTLLEKIPKLSQPIFNDTYLDGLMELVLYYTSLPYWLDMVNAYSSVRFIIHEIYRAMVARKELTRIEDLSHEEKLKYWNKADKKLLLKDRMKATRAIYLMEKILEQPDKK
jgi:hypothetical protein